MEISIQESFRTFLSLFPFSWLSAFLHPFFFFLPDWLNDCACVFVVVFLLHCRLSCLSILGTLMFCYMAGSGHVIGSSLMLIHIGICNGILLIQDL